KPQVFLISSYSRREGQSCGSGRATLYRRKRIAGGRARMARKTKACLARSPRRMNEGVRRAHPRYLVRRLCGQRTLRCHRFVGWCLFSLRSQASGSGQSFFFNN
ncbi:unnamed protein product, partial [Ectocarpus fasciculatus]